MSESLDFFPLLLAIETLQMNFFQTFFLFRFLASPGKETLVQDMASGAQAHLVAAHIHFGCCSACFEIVMDMVSITSRKCLDVHYKPKNVHNMGPKYVWQHLSFFEKKMDWAQDRQGKEDQFNTFYHIAPHIVTKSLPNIEWYLASAPTLKSTLQNESFPHKKMKKEKKSFLIQNPPPTNSNSITRFKQDMRKRQ
jgi:hypothetical protein